MGKPEIIVVACVNNPAARNFQNAVLDGIPQSQYKQFTDRPNVDPARIWGVKKKGTWEQAVPGDYLFFYTQNEKYRYVAQIADKEENSKLAGDIFHTHGEDTFKYIFYLETLRKINLDSKKLHRDYAGHKNKTPTTTQRFADNTVYEEIESQHGSIEEFIEDHQVGTDIHGPDDPSPVSKKYRDKLQTVLQKYENVIEKGDWDHPVLRVIKDGIPSDIRTLVEDFPDEIEVDHTKSVGNLSNIPWVNIYDRRITDGAQEGLYVVYLFDTGTNELHLTLNQGVKTLRDTHNTNTARDVLKTRAEILRRHISLEGFENDDISFSPHLITNRNTLFQEGTVCHRTYNLDRFPDAETIEDDLKTIVREYVQLVEQGIYDELLQAFDPESGKQDDPSQKPEGLVFPEQSIEDLLNSESRQAGIYQRALTHLLAGKNVIFYGPPGTGKTRAARLLAKKLCKNVDIVTANAEWSNYQVVGGYAPKEDGWESSPGFLTEAAMSCQRSLTAETRPMPSWLIVDELNRANLDQAFGEVFTLLDLEYRETESLQYADEKVSVPLSFRLLATMNTYDQAQLFSLGYAFRRRFAFISVPSLLSAGSEAPSTSGGPGSVDFERDSETEWLRTLLQDTACDSLFVDPTKKSVIRNDIDVVYPQFGDIDNIQSAIQGLTNDEKVGVGSLDFLDTLIAFAQGVTSEDIIDVGQALLIDAIKYIIVHQMLFPDETDQSTIDDAIVAYVVPQFDNFMPELRRAETIDRESDATERYDEVIELARRLELHRTATTLIRAKDSKQILR